MALNNLQRLICHKIQSNQNQTYNAINYFTFSPQSTHLQISSVLSIFVLILLLLLLLLVVVVVVNSLEVFHSSVNRWSFTEVWVSRTLLSILADLSFEWSWFVLRFPTPPVPFSKVLGTIPSAKLQLVLPPLSCSTAYSAHKQGLSTCLSFCFLWFSLWFTGTANPLDNNFSFFLSFFLSFCCFV